MIDDGVFSLLGEIRLPEKDWSTMHHDTSGEQDKTEMSKEEGATRQDNSIGCCSPTRRSMASRERRNGPKRSSTRRRANCHWVWESFKVLRVLVFQSQRCRVKEWKCCLCQSQNSKVTK